MGWFMRETAGISCVVRSPVSAGCEGARVPFDRLRTGLAAVGACACIAVAAPAGAQQITPSEFVTTVNITVVPIAGLEFFDPNPLLFLTVPPPGSTIPAAGVAFTVIGNASASLSAEPASFLQVPGSVLFPPLLGTAHLGRATQSGQEIGYNLELTFPAFGVPSRRLPVLTQGPAVSDVVNIIGAGGEVPGTLDLIANPNWTPTGGLPLPGLYEGEIILTLSPS